jgi:hypothetical protein
MLHLTAQAARLQGKKSILGRERQGDPVKGVDDILIQGAQFFTVGDGARDAGSPEPAGSASRRQGRSPTRIISPSTNPE